MGINTVTKKIMLLIMTAGILLLLVVSLLFPSIFYYVMKSYMIEQVSSVVSSCALRQSYIWRNNSYINEIVNDGEMSVLILDYYAGEEDAAEDIVACLPVLYNGTKRESEETEEDYGYIVSVNYLLLFTSEGDIFYDESAKEAAEVLLASDWYQEVDRETELFAHLPILGDGETACSYFGVVESFWAGDVNCFVVNLVAVEDILRQFQELEDFGLEDYLIYCNGQILYQNVSENSRLSLEEYPEEMFNGNQYETIVWENGTETNFAVLCTYKREDYRIVVNVTKEEMLAPYETAFFYFRLLLGGITAFLLVMFAITLKANLSRLTSLERKMDRVRSGDYKVTVEDKGNDEIGRLAKTFTMMLEKIREDMENEERMQYTLLVSAIDPHYIYNTLNTVTALAELGRNKDIIVVNTALIGTLKDRLKMKNYKIFDTVRSEKETLEQYMIIQSYLCSQKIQYTFDIKDEDLGLVIPKNIIQPLVENSIKHGILCKDDEEQEPGKIRVAVKREEEEIEILVEDNGAGMSEEQIEHFFGLQSLEMQMKEKDLTHIGVFNVRMRLNYLYQKQCSFHVESEEGKGTCICILLPIREKEDCAVDESKHGYYDGGAWQLQDFKPDE